MSLKPPRKPLPLAAGRSKSAPKEKTKEEKRLGPKLSDNLDLLRRYLADSDDIIFRRLEVTGLSLAAAAVYTDGLIRRETVEDQILKPIMLELAMIRDRQEKPAPGELLEFIERRALTVGEVRRTPVVAEIILAVLSGDTALLADGADLALIVNSRGWPARAVEEPVTESLVRGPREGFTETLRTNTALLRRRLRDPNFKIRQFRTGRRSQTDCALAYVEGIVRPDVVEEVKKRLETIDIDFILETGDLEQLVEDSPFSIFPQVQYSERPDKVVAGLLEGRVAILVDGTPLRHILKHPAPGPVRATRGVCRLGQGPVMRFPSGVSSPSWKRVTR